MLPRFYYEFTLGDDIIPHKHSPEIELHKKKGTDVTSRKVTSNTSEFLEKKRTNVLQYFANIISAKRTT